MKKNSLITKVTLIFIFFILLLSMFFTILLKYQSETDLKAMKERQLPSINYIFVLYRNNLSPRGISEYFSNFDLRKVSNQNLRISVLKKGKIVFQKDSKIGRFSSIRYNDRYYLYIDNMVSNILLESQYKKRDNDYIWFGFIASLIILIFMYFSMIRSIAPLKTLSEQIRKFASGDMDIDCRSNKDDEIAEVANEFDAAAKKLKDLIDSRQLFLRTIMHELKTPIGKGRIVSEMIQDERAKGRLISIFERLDLLINEFSKIEKIVSKNYSLQKQEYKLVDVIDCAVDLLMLDDDKKELHVKMDAETNLMIHVDFESFSLALKNLLDNAIKYADDKKVFIRVIDEKLYIINTGKKFTMDIKEYEKPFVSGKNEIKKGLGLGLYIVKNIVKLNDLKLDYKYEDNQHKFIIDLGQQNE